MKKVFFALVLIGGMLAMTGCAKECKCVGKLNGEVKYERVFDLQEGSKCSDANTYMDIAGIKIEIKCTPVLF